ncbi:MAG: dCTP deaminase [Pseudonocardiaceae bacterium]
MILTGSEIARAVRRGEIVIKPFATDNLEPNSYRVTLGDSILVSTAVDLDARTVPQMRRDIISASGYVLEPNELYLGETAEILGAHSFATTLHATRSVASLGVWINFSAPLGHMGAIVRWTLELRSIQRIVVYPRMSIGKLAFWSTVGIAVPYRGRYLGSTEVQCSKLSIDGRFQGRGRL